MTTGEHRLPGFVELAELGAGAQGEVVLARHESGGGPVAIKYLAADLLGDTEARSIFRDEAQILKRVNNPHVARLLDYLESPWGAAIILEAVPGRPLRKVLDGHEGALTAEAALATLKGSLLGLAAAHAVGVVHRDYKPGNVLVQDDGQSKLIDFGVAVLTGQGGQAGTPAYMSPEQWAGGPATPATDLYAATGVFVECVTGKKPFEGTTLAELKTAHSEGFTSFERVPEPLRPLVHRGLAKSPSDRVWNAYEFVSELESIAVQTYGPDWERRGFLALGALAATVVTAVPLAMLGGALLTPGASATSAAGSTAAGHVSAGLTQGATSVDVMTKTGTSASKGFLSKVGGPKGAVAIGSVGVGAVIAAWLFWPSEPSVGGEDHGLFHAGFKRPGALTSQPNMPASEGPTLDAKISVAPARVKPGTTVRVVVLVRARMPYGGKYLPGGRRQCFGKDANRQDIVQGFDWSVGGGNSAEHDPVSGSGWPTFGLDSLALYRSPPAKREKLPGLRTPLLLPTPGVKSNDVRAYVRAECAYMSEWTETRTLTFPGSAVVRPGRYLVSPISPLRVTRTIRDGKPITPAEASAFTEGTLPMIEVLDD